MWGWRDLFATNNDSQLALRTQQINDLYSEEKTVVSPSPCPGRRAPKGTLQALNRFSPRGWRFPKQMVAEHVYI